MFGQPIKKAEDSDKTKMVNIFLLFFWVVVYPFEHIGPF